MSCSLAFRNVSPRKASRCILNDVDGITESIAAVEAFEQPMLLSSEGHSLPQSSEDLTLARSIDYLICRGLQNTLEDFLAVAVLANLLVQSGDVGCLRLLLPAAEIA